MGIFLIGKIKSLSRKFAFALLLAISIGAPAYAINNVKSLTIVLTEEGTPITSEQTIRLSLWSDGIIANGDIVNGVIDTNAPNYANYQTEITETPNANGEITIAFADLTDFPQITLDNQYLMVEYKNSGEPVTSYHVYIGECINNADIDRFPILQRPRDTSRLSFSNDGTDSDNFILDDDNTIGAGENIVLQFGETLAETIKWDFDNTRFTISDDLRVEGNLASVGQLYVAADHSATDSDGILNFGLNDGSWENFRWESANDRFYLSNNLTIGGNLEMEGVTFTLNADNASQGATIDLIANQGSDSDGTLRYNAETNRWEISNDEGAFAAIATEVQVFYAYDSIGGQAIVEAGAELNLDSTIIADPNYSLSGSEVTFNSDGLYYISTGIGSTTAGSQGSDRADILVKVREDSLGIGNYQNIPQAEISCALVENVNNFCSLNFVHYFSNTDKIKVRFMRTNGTTNMVTSQGTSRLIIEKIR